MAEPIFECRSASVALAFGGQARPIVSDIGLSVHEAEFLSIVGPSGTGKTTLLRMLGGLLRPTSGEIRMRGEVLTGPPDGVVIVFQDYGNALLQWRTVAANVAFGIERHLPRKECDERVAAVLELVGLSKRASDYPWQLSGGMQQRVQIARALALRPAVLLMDEPFAALDAMTKAGLQDELLRLRDQTGTSFVFITHDIEEAVYLGDRVAVLKGSPGRIDNIVDITLPSPRDQVTTRQLPEFLAYRYDLHQAIGHG
ncbi:ABC transporter ATP-binding protein [Rhodopseudomonas sp. B29]|uniref:ABC transporter ATP-binding protein n=1 Tax=Rhodopseudomonas sp. B29 TaxID=95607 RepID=UPI00034A60B4|nr:ABC transporter ATP-binding protein [Rhodopseudomonas sp. B29]